MSGEHAFGTLGSMQRATVPAWQGSLLDGDEPSFDPGFAQIGRRPLERGAWVDHAQGWLRGSDQLFAKLIEHAPWDQRIARMYGELITEPRLTAPWKVADVPDELGILRDLAAALSERYDVAFTSVGCNLYRTGADSVAWHGDRVARERHAATIAIVSLGHRRPFRLRPKGGGASIGYELGRGDLLVMGGTCQRTWDHTVPKVARVSGPRISVTFRHAYA